MLLPYHRSRKLCSTSVTAGPGTAQWTSCHGGRLPYLGERHHLGVAEVGIIVAAVAEVDPSDEGDVLGRPARMADDHELLVVGAAPAGPGVQQHLAAVLADPPDELRVGLLGLPQRLGV